MEILHLYSTSKAHLLTMRMVQRNVPVCDKESRTKFTIIQNEGKPKKWRSGCKERFVRKLINSREWFVPFRRTNNSIATFARPRS